MRHRRPSMGLARPAALLAIAASLLGGCAEMHRGAEAVGHIGSAPAPAVDADVTPPRPDVKTVRPRGAPRRAPADEAADAGRPATVAAAVPSPGQIFDFHPTGTGPDAWRQPFVIDTSDGPLAADVRRSSAELRAFLADQKSGKGVYEGTGAIRTVKPRCGENEVAQGKPGCRPTPPRSAAVAPAPQ